MHIVKKFNRFELKYVLPYKQMACIKKDVLKYALPDPFYEDGRNKYSLVSLYYDSPDHRFYWEKVDGIKYRRKLRIRWYEVDDCLEEDSIVFAEIKQRVDRVTQKRRFPLKYKDALMFFNEGIVPECEVEDKELVDEMYSLLKLYNLQPTGITSYDREAFVGTDYDMGLRITFDTHVTYKTKDFKFDTGTYDGFIIPPNFVIMEIKTNDRVPYWITELVAGNQLQLIRVSKYCQGLERASTINY